MYNYASMFVLAVYIQNSFLAFLNIKIYYQLTHACTALPV